MDHDERDAPDWPEPDRPDDSAAEPTTDETERPPAGEPDAQAPGEAPVEPAPAEPAPEPVEPAPSEPAPEPATEEPAAADVEGWPSQDAASTGESTPPAAAESPAWPTEPPEAGDAEPGTWPTSAPERGDEVEAATPEPDWPPEETAAAAGAGAAGATPAEAEAETPPDDSAWTGAAAGGAAAGAAAAEDAAPPPEEAEAYPTGDVAAVAAAGAAAHGVPDAEAATGESTQCPRCGTENPPGLAFCRNCGQRLVAAGVATTVERPGTPEGSIACPRCGTHNRTGVAFCQNCGANLRGTAPGYVPPAVAGEAAAAGAVVERRGAVLGPVVLLIGMVGLITGYLLPFAYGDDSLFDRAFGSGGYGFAFWTGYPTDASLTDAMYFGLAAATPILVVLLAGLAVAGFMRARPGSLQISGLIITLAWSVWLIVMFLVVEVIGSWSGDIVDVLRQLSPGGIILFLASLIVLIGTLTRFGRS